MPLLPCFPAGTLEIPALSCLPSQRYPPARPCAVHKTPSARQRPPPASVCLDILRRATNACVRPGVPGGGWEGRRSCWVPPLTWMFPSLAAPNPCQPSPCSPLAQCSVSPMGQARCYCPENYHGDGTVCLPQDPCTTNFGGCPSNSTLCLYQKPGKVSQEPSQAHTGCRTWASPRALGGGCRGLCSRGRQFSWTAMLSPAVPSNGQAICSCQPGLVSIKENPAAGCIALCHGRSCDQSATCQVTPNGKTR